MAKCKHRFVVKKNIKLKEKFSLICIKCGRIENHEEINSEIINEYKKIFINLDDYLNSKDIPKKLVKKIFSEI